MLQHHPARTDANPRRVSEQMRNQYLRRGACQGRHIVMLGYPEAVQAKLFGPARQPCGLMQCFGGRLVRVDGALVEKAENVCHSVRVRYSIQSIKSVDYI